MSASVEGWSPSWDFYITRLQNLSTDRWVTIMLRHLNRSDEADQAVEEAWDAATEVAVADPVADYEVPEAIFSAALDEAGGVAEAAAELGAFRRDRVDALKLARSTAESFVMQMPLDWDALRGYVADLASLAASALVVRDRLAADELAMALHPFDRLLTVSAIKNRMSEDGELLWDGANWHRVVTEDGSRYWDGATWTPLTGPTSPGRFGPCTPDVAHFIASLGGLRPEQWQQVADRSDALGPLEYLHDPIWAAAALAENLAIGVAKEGAAAVLARDALSPEQFHVLFEAVRDLIPLPRMPR